VQGLLEGLMRLFQVILGAWLLAGGHVALSEDLLEVIPRSEEVLPQAKEPVVRRLVEHDG
jgi:hypothetical protein